MKYGDEYVRNPALRIVCGCLAAVAVWVLTPLIVIIAADWAYIFRSVKIALCDEIRIAGRRFCELYRCSVMSNRWFKPHATRKPIQ